MHVHFNDEPLQRLQFSFECLSGGDVSSAGGSGFGILLCSRSRFFTAAVTNLPHAPVHALAPVVVPALRP